VSTKMPSFVHGAAFNHFCTTKRKACRHQCSGALHGYLVFLLTRDELLQLPRQQCAHTAAALRCEASSLLKKVPVNGDSDVVFAHGGHDRDTRIYA
jgi:hypothetical protein